MILPAVCSVFLLPSIARADNGPAPPVDPTQSQYVEQIPSSSGSTPTSGLHSSKVSPTLRKKLATAGKDAAVLARIASTGPSASTPTAKPKPAAKQRKHSAASSRRSRTHAVTPPRARLVTPSAASKSSGSPPVRQVVWWLLAAVAVVSIAVIATRAARGAAVLSRSR